MFLISMASSRPRNKHFVYQLLNYIEKKEEKSNYLVFGFPRQSVAHARAISIHRKEQQVHTMWKCGNTQNQKQTHSCTVAIESEVTEEERNTKMSQNIQSYNIIYGNRHSYQSTEKMSTKDETDSKRAARQEVNLFVF